MIERVKGIIKANKTIAENFIYITLLQVFLLVAPLITYPYLVKVLGREVYGMVITAQVLVSYFSIVIDFGSNSIAARYIALRQGNKDLLSDTLSCILSARFYIWCIGFVVYLLIVNLIPSFKEHFLMFLLMFGMTLNDLLFPQFFFQGIEQMKHITIINLLIKVIFILLIFVFVNEVSDYVLVPLFYSTGYCFGGLFALNIIHKRFGVRLALKPINNVICYIKDCAPLLAKDLIATVKDKFNFFLIGKFVGMGDVVVYDLCVKFVSVFSKPVGILGTVLLPRFSKYPNSKRQMMIFYLSFAVSLLLVITANLFLDKIVFVFLHEHIDLMPIRLILLAPLMLAISQCIGYVYILANGMNKYMLYSIIIATFTYCICMSITIIADKANSIIPFVLIVLLSYFTETLYRVYIFLKKKK